MIHTSKSSTNRSGDTVVDDLAAAELAAVSSLLKTDLIPGLEQVFLDDRQACRRGANHDGALLDCEHARVAEVRRWRLASLKLDILVFCDVGMDASTLPFGRFAPVQVAFWGHPVTTGLWTIDYFLSSELFELWPNEPAAHNDCRAPHSEQLVIAEGINTYFTRVDPDREKSEAWRESIILTVRESNPLVGCSNVAIYMCAQNPLKLHAFVPVLARLLVADECGIIVLLRNPATPLAHAALVARLDEQLRLELSAAGFGASAASLAAAMRAVAGRLVFVDQGDGHAAFVALQCAADVFLDPHPFGGGVTALEALACGHVRVVTAPPLQSVPHLAAGFMLHADRAGGEGEGQVLMAGSTIRTSTGAIMLNYSSQDDVEVYVREAIGSAYAAKEAKESTRARQLNREDNWNSDVSVEGWSRFLLTSARESSSTHL